MSKYPVKHSTDTLRCLGLEQASCWETQQCFRLCVCVSHCSRLLNLNSVFMAGFVKAEHRRSHSVAPPLSTLSRSLHISPHSSLSPHKSISRSLHSKVHYSLLPAASSVCYLSHSHYLCVPPSNSPLSSLYWLKSDLMFFSLTFFLGLPLSFYSSHCFVCHHFL